MYVITEGQMEQVAMLRQGAETWNRWRSQNPSIRPNLIEADLSEADLSDANLRGADLNRANLIESNLGEANLSWAKLIEAQLSGANFRGADLDKVNLSEADLSDANLRGADLSWARIGETIFGNTNLKDAQGLDYCQHIAPSVLDHRTILNSGRLPLPFLQGCGLPDALIEYLSSLLQEAIQFYSCFISYSTKDQEFADKLYADFQNKGVRCWFAPHKIQSRKKIHDQIDEAIRLYDRLLLILSEHSMESEWVKTEIAHARQKEVEQRRQVLFPIGLTPFSKIREWKCFDADTGKDSAREIREYYVPDFSNWKDHDSYTSAFRRLLRDLKAAQSTDSTAT
jgi:hypothetical protein